MSEKGQSLIELIIAVGIFVTIVGGLAFFVLNSYVSGRLSYEVTKANFLAEEGIEAAKSIRDNKFSDLVTGSHGLAIFGGHWVFQGTEEELRGQLKNGKRIIQIEDISQDRKKITSRVNWQFSEGRTEEVRLVSYLTNWQKIPVAYCTGTCTPCESFTNRTACNAQLGCSWSAKLKMCTGTCTPCDTFLDQTSCQAQAGCSWVSE